jgi:serine/threonine-protein kinase PknK
LVSTSSVSIPNRIRSLAILAPRRGKIPQDSGIAAMIAEIEEDTAVRLLLAGPSDKERQAACARAGALLGAIDATRRPLAALRATLLLVRCLAALHREDEARATLAPPAARCGELGLTRLLADEEQEMRRLLG